ncbi:unnamed protein product, partial [marine sediment metagenome]
NDPASHLILPDVTGLIPDTGQTKCYDDAGEIACPQSGEAFHGQDAAYTINPPSYVKIDAQGYYLPDSATNWAMVHDLVTGLIWATSNGHHTYTWYDISEDFLSVLNDSSFGGFHDWRLPTLEELRAIVDNGVLHGQTVNTHFFHIAGATYPYYWSSTTFAEDASYAWVLDFDHGGDRKERKSDDHYVLAVRGGKAESIGNLVANADGTVTDTSTGLMW